MQVTRVVKVDLEKGSCEVLLKKLSKALDKDSIRVDGIGPASITEVSFQVYTLTSLTPSTPSHTSHLTPHPHRTYQ